MHGIDAEVHVRLEAASRIHDRRDEVFLEQVEELRRGLITQGVPVVSDEQPGTKGGAEVASTVNAIIAGGTGLTSLCGVVALWLRQRGDRLIRMTVKAADGTEQSVELEGKNLSDASLLRFAQTATKHLK